MKFFKVYFDSMSSDVEDSPVHDRFVNVERLRHAVTPPMQNIYSFRTVKEVDDSMFTYGPKQSKTSESDTQSSNFDSCESNSSVETLESVPEPVVVEPKVVSQPKVWSDAPIIKEYESDSDDEYVNIAGEKAVSDVGGIRETAVKPSAAHVWGKQGLPCLNINADYMVALWLFGWCKAEVLRKEFAQSTEDLLLQARATNTNTVNTVSTPLSTANPSNVFSTGDINGNSNDDIFTNASYNDEGVVAEFSNLESTMNVSPIPTSKIHSIYPTTQILRDPKSAVQTRASEQTVLEPCFYKQGWLLGTYAKRMGIDYDVSFAPVARIEALELDEEVVNDCNNTPIRVSPSALTKDCRSLLMWFRLSSFDPGSLHQIVTMLRAMLIGNPQHEVVNFWPEKSYFWQCKKAGLCGYFYTEAEYVAAANCCGSYSKFVNIEMIIYWLALVQGRQDDRVNMFGLLVVYCELRFILLKVVNTAGTKIYTARHQELDSPEQTDSGKDFSNLLIVDSLLKTYMSNDPPLSRGYTLGSGEDSLKQMELMEFVQNCVTHLKLEDDGGITSLPNTEIFEQLALMGYATDSDKLTFQKGGYLVNEHSFISSNDHELTHLPQNKLSTILITSNIPCVLNELMDLVTQLTTKVGSLENELMNTKKVYGSALTKLVNRVKKLEKQVKTGTTRRGTKIVFSEDEAVEEDSSKQGRSLINELDMDADFSLVPPHDAEIQEKISDDTKEERKRIARDAEIAKQLQEEYDKIGKKEAVTEVDIVHVIDWVDPAVIRNQAYKMKDFKGMSYDDIRPIFEKVWDQIHSFVPMDSEEEVQRLKRAGQDVEGKPAKRQRTEEVSESVQEQTDELSQEQLNQMVIIVPDEGINVEALQTKYPIIGWEVHSNDTMQFWKIIRVGNHTEVYQVFEDMLKNFDRDDLIKLWSLVQERYNSSGLTEDKEIELWVELKMLFEPNAENLLELQKYMHDPLKW
ncbi:hypothetical protein Tco_1184159 [Tanacetum coccineum]